MPKVIGHVPLTEADSYHEAFKRMNELVEITSDQFNEIWFTYIAPNRNKVLELQRQADDVGFALLTLQNCLQAYQDRQNGDG